MNIAITADKGCSTYWHVRANERLVGDIANYSGIWKFGWHWMKQDFYNADQLAEITLAANRQVYLLNLTRRLLA